MEVCDSCKKSTEKILGWIDGRSYCSLKCCEKLEKQHKLNPIMRTKYKQNREH